MYLRHSIVRKDGKTRKYWRLVESVRIGKKVIQRTVAQLGDLDAKGRLRASELARRLGGHAEQPGLFDQPLEKEVAQIRLNGVKLERVRRFGDVWLACKLWRMAKFDEFFDEHLSLGGEDIPWATTAKILTAARFCEPSSELHIAEDWIRKTALADILDVNCVFRSVRSLCRTCPITPSRPGRSPGQIGQFRRFLRSNRSHSWCRSFK